MFFDKAQDKIGGEAAKYGLGLIYEEGKIVPQDIEKAMKLYFESADADVLDAQIHLGKIFHDNQNLDKARYWYERGCNQGDDYTCDLLKKL